MTRDVGSDLLMAAHYLDESRATLTRDSVTLVVSH